MRVEIARSQRYRFSLLVNELRGEATVASYLTSVLAFINCLIVSHDNINDRIRIRNELIGIYALARNFRSPKPVFPNFLTCYPKSHPDVGLPFPSRNHARTLLFTEMTSYFGCTAN